MIETILFYVFTAFFLYVITFCLAKKTKFHSIISVIAFGFEGYAIYLMYEALSKAENIDKTYLTAHIVSSICFIVSASFIFISGSLMLKKTDFELKNYHKKFVIIFFISWLVATSTGLTFIW